jgi:hypothetical protein
MLLGNSVMPLLQQGFILPMLVLKPEKESFILIQDIIKDCAKHVVMIGLTFTLPVTVKKTGDDCIFRSRGWFAFKEMIPEIFCQRAFAIARLSLDV